MRPLYQEVADDIMNKIVSGEYPEGYQLMTEMELSEKYKVSRVTMRKAMELLVTAKHVYRISGKGTYVGASKRSITNGTDKLIGVILCNFSASYGTELLKALEKNISDNGYSMVFANSYYDRETETKAIRKLVDIGVKCIIIQPVHNEAFNSELMKLSLTGFPFVLIDRNLPGLSIPFVGTDNKKSIYEAMKYIFDQGHKNVCMFTPVSEDTSTIEERLSAFDKAFLLNKGEISGRFAFSKLMSPLVNNPDENMIEKDIEAIEGFLKSNPQITCAFASEYAVARMIRTAAKNLAIDIPNDLSLITFDNHNDSFRKNATTFIRQRENEIGNKAIEIMKALLSGSEIKSKFFIDSDIVDNQSVKRINYN